MKQIRRNVFETNNSTHSISFSKKQGLTELSQYGWIYLYQSWEVWVGNLKLLRPEEKAFLSRNNGSNGNSAIQTGVTRTNCE